MEHHYWQIGIWLRIPVSIHWTVLIAFAWLYLFFWDLLATAIASAAFLALVIAHEFGHVVVLRKRKIPIECIELFGLHGKTSHEWASATDEILIAWGGVGAQVVILLIALAIRYALEPEVSPIIWEVAGPILFVFIKLNIFMIVVALLPIGPFDGHSAWAVIPWLRKSIRRHMRTARENALFPEKKLTPERHLELETSSAKATEELLKMLGKNIQNKNNDP